MAYTTIKKPSDYFNTKLYTGNGGTNAITGVGFQPDLIWIKDRDTAGNSHIWTDSVRGNTKNIYSNLTNAEATNTDRVTSFDSDGFTLGADASQGVNDSGSSQVSWNWLAGGTASSNTQGDIASTVSANTTSGFSIVSYTGTGSNATVGHGLGVAPKCIIVKDRDGVRSWIVGHDSIGWGNYLALDLTDASTSLSSIWNSTAPTSSVFSVGTASNTNFSGNNLIAYCFAEKKGFSKFGSYTGNGNADGTFVYTGFKPAFILGKNASGTSAAFENWFIYDDKRNTFNPTYNVLFPNSNSAEGANSAQSLDLLSNGFKARSVETRFNESGSTYIYMAFAEEPLVGDNPATAR